MIGVLCGVIKDLTYRAEECPTNDEASIKTRGRIELTAVMFAGNFCLGSGEQRCSGGGQRTVDVGGQAIWFEPG